MIIEQLLTSPYFSLILILYIDFGTFSLKKNITLLLWQDQILYLLQVEKTTSSSPVKIKLKFTKISCMGHVNLKKKCLIWSHLTERKNEIIKKKKNQKMIKNKEKPFKIAEVLLPSKNSKEENKKFDSLVSDKNQLQQILELL